MTMNHKKKKIMKINKLLIKKVILGADHAGYGQKEYLKKFLTEIGCEFDDVGTNNFQPYDYPDVAELVCKKVQQNLVDTYGIIVCGSGVGVCIAANKFNNIRAGLVDRKELAYYAVAHDKSNVLCLSSRFTTFHDNCEIIKTFLSTAFEGGRHVQRVNKINLLEKEKKEN